MFERPSPEQMTGLSTGDFDLGFVAAGTPQIEGCETLLVERAAYVAAVPADWPLARRETISLAELAEQPFILPPALYAPQSSATMAMFKSIGVMPHVAQEATQTNTTISLVGAGLGCSLVMATAALTQSRNVRFVAVQDVAAYGRWELIMAWRPDPPQQPRQGLRGLHRRLRARPSPAARPRRALGLTPPLHAKCSRRYLPRK